MMSAVVQFLLLFLIGWSISIIVIVSIIVIIIISSSGSSSIFGIIPHYSICYCFCCCR